MPPPSGHAPPPRPVDVLDVPAGSDEVLPPADRRAVLTEAGAGLALVAAATAVAVVADFALGGGPGVLATVRLVLCSVGAVVAGHAVSRRADLWATWAGAAAAGYLAGGVAVPAHWDSLRLLLWVLAAVATAGAVFAALPRHVRYPAVASLVVVHFGGILSAVTSPDPSPWLTSIVGAHFYLPYLQFAYLRNAYHFYSPEPGPANLLFALVEYEVDRPDPGTGKSTVSEWAVIPRRGAKPGDPLGVQTRDPLAVSYYRRLSITEYSARFQPGTGQSPDELERVWADRRRVAAGVTAGRPQIPMPDPTYDPQERWYQYPQVDASRYLLPSYARHLAVALAPPGRAVVLSDGQGAVVKRVVNVKLYRAEHRIVTAQYFVKLNYDPYHPTLYRVHFLGDYAADGTLKDPKDPMLYWLLPVTMRRPDVPFQGWAIDQFNDYLSLHAGHEFDWRALRP